MKIYDDGIPLIMAYGYPVTGKSTAVNAAMAVIVQNSRENIGGIKFQELKYSLFIDFLCF
jgi:tRNA uridine 5-carbamoylmethylation protein Kti12